MKTVQNEVACVKMPLPCKPAIPRSSERSAPAAMHDAAPIPGIQPPVIARAVREAGSMVYELLGMAELMRVAYEKGELACAQNRLEIVVKEAAALSSAFSTILEFIGTESVSARTSSQCFDIVALLQEVSDASRALVQNKPVKVMATACATHLVINGDLVKIRRIMMGLMSNAARFTDKGRIAVILNREDDWIRLTVTDNGRGMSQEQIDEVFSSSDHEYDNEINTPLPFGLEIRIVKNLVKQLHGSISVSSKLGEGTIVEVRLPLELQNNPSGS